MERVSGRLNSWFSNQVSPWRLWTSPISLCSLLCVDEPMGGFSQKRFPGDTCIDDDASPIFRWNRVNWPAAATVDVVV